MIEMLAGVFISCVCCYKVPQTGLFKSTEIYSLTVLEAGVPNGGTGKVVSFWRL
jgi:hypothetical protein